ncbi:MAG TPA: hypothetical protein VGV67_02720 [Solirubrobacteraceae bacterium]|nr:hypothetical protein [Solirubrobacteraceae bacterium]
MKRLIILAVSAAAFMTIAPLSASAGPAGKSQARVIGPVVLNGDGTATVRARYICQESDHLWVSAKQMADTRPDPRLQEEGSSALAANWMQSHPDGSTFTCDGQWHTGSWVIETTDFGPLAPDWGPLERGQAWVQFCLLTATNENEFIVHNRWAAVVR